MDRGWIVTEGCGVGALVGRSEGAGMGSSVGTGVGSGVGNAVGVGTGAKDAMGRGSGVGPWSSARDGTVKVTFSWPAKSPRPSLMTAPFSMSA